MIELEKTEIYMVDYSDVEIWIREFYNMKTPYELPYLEEKSNDSAIAYIIDGSMSEDEINDIDHFIETKRPKSFRTQTYLNYMAIYDTLPPGNYVINISW